MWFLSKESSSRKTCAICGQQKPLSQILGICRDCILNDFETAKKYIIDAHRKSREPYGLPYPPPTDGKTTCNLCSNMCSLSDGDVSFCGIKWFKDGKLYSLANGDRAVMHPYLDPHVTNCCANWFCPAGTGLGYPEYAVRPGPEYGYYNLAVFFYGCNFNCLFCQNSEHKEVRKGTIITRTNFVRYVLSNSKITCICYFGGSPEPHLPFTIRANKDIIEEKGDRIIRICYEWNGAGNNALVKKIGEQVLATGGIIKFDLKAPKGSKLSIALSGVPNDDVYKNFETLYHNFWGETPIPIVTATTLLVPGYIMPEDVEEIAKFISELDPNIPYSLLIFHPDWMMRDLPITPRKIVAECEKVARKYLKNVHVGNKFLLGVAPEDL